MGAGADACYPLSRGAVTAVTSFGQVLQDGLIKADPHEPDRVHNNPPKRGQVVAQLSVFAGPGPVGVLPWITDGV